MREKVKKLWKLCFSDNDEFIDMYFNLRYNSEVNVAIESGDEVIAALQMLPYPITFHGNSVPTAYISGVLALTPITAAGALCENCCPRHSGACIVIILHLPLSFLPNLGYLAITHV